MNITIAPDSFKGSLDALPVATAIAEGWLSVRPHDDLTLLPQADGGEGTLDAMAAALPDAQLVDAGPVTGPDGRPVEAHWLRLTDDTAVVELAQSSGLPLMGALDPLGATTRGLGETIARTLDAGARSLIVGLGGSASTDGGAGALSALGLGLLDVDGLPIGDGGGALNSLVRVEGATLRPAPAGGIRLLSDVRAPLLGATGAAAVFGPQKGATPGDVAALDVALSRFADLMGGDPGAPGAGAAGGTGYGFSTAWGAVLESGSAVVAELTGLVAAVASADVVLTGEGRFDATSLTGKVVGHVLELAHGAGARAGVIAGRVDADPGVWIASLTELAGSPAAATDDPATWLRAAGAAAARDFT